MSASPVPGGDRDRAIGTVVSAFADDPVERWMFPDPDEYLEHFPWFVAAFAGAAFEQRTAWQLGEFAAVALWLPPNAETDGAAIARVFTEASGRTSTRTCSRSASRWSAPTRPTRTGTCPGSRSIRPARGRPRRRAAAALPRDRRRRRPARVPGDAQPRTIPLYERHDFELTGQAQAGSCPPVTFMLRPSR